MPNGMEVVDAKTRDKEGRGGALMVAGGGGARKAEPVWRRVAREKRERLAPSMALADEWRSLRFSRSLQVVGRLEGVKKTRQEIVFWCCAVRRWKEPSV